MFEKLPNNDRSIKTSRIYNVPIDKIVQNKTLLREYDMISVVKLASSIRKIGLIEPIILRLPCRDLPRPPEEEFTERENSLSLPCPADKSKKSQKLSDKLAEIKKITEQARLDEENRKYILISGGYRLRACKMLGMSEIPARFALFTENDEASVQMVGEFFGSCSDIFERARKFVRCCIDLNMNACELAENLGFQRKYAISLFNIAKMTDSEADLASLHKIPFETLAVIAKLDSPIARIALIDEAKDGQTSQKELARLIEDINSGKSKSFTQNRKFFCKDMRIYVNTMKKTVKAMIENGLDASIDVNEGYDGLQIVVNVSRETSSKVVEDERIIPTGVCKTVENPVETIENRGVSLENYEFSTEIIENQANSVKTVEKCVENVENSACVSLDTDIATIQAAAPTRDGDRQIPTADLAAGLA